MAEKKQESFTVTDRRLFTSEGEIRQEVSQEEVSSAAASTPQPAPAAQPDLAPPGPEADAPPAPTAAEQKEQADEGVHLEKGDVDALEIAHQTKNVLDQERA